ncbi:hypothetical protein TNCV_1664561 [Trichonephila clavipes]|uniref:Uncharacterized protein n=1 Tax=Trichonephila clavipes TaxID=2585209 RepID=A0A8X6RZW9_TRICX|nr:hypothetical protein TNCV_1664561 [Trichonephila clavipes]
MKVCWPVVMKHTLEGILSVKVISRLIDFPYGVGGTAMEMIAVAPAYCLKEPMELGRRPPRVDPIRSTIRDYWEHERGPPRGFKRGCGIAASQGPREMKCDNLSKTEEQPLEWFDRERDQQKRLQGQLHPGEDPIKI